MICLNCGSHQIVYKEMYSEDEGVKHWEWTPECQKCGAKGDDIAEEED